MPAIGPQDFSVVKRKVLEYVLDKRLSDAESQVREVGPGGGGTGKRDREDPGLGEPNSRYP